MFRNFLNAELNGKKIKFSTKTVTHDMIKTMQEITNTQELGRGATSDVFQCKISNEICAVKLFNEAFFSKHSLNINCLEQEIKIMLNFKKASSRKRVQAKMLQYNMSHLGIIEIKHIISGNNNKSGYSMVLADTTLLDYLEDIQFNLFHRYELLRQLLFSIAMLHNEGIIHRDLKPDNILILNGQPIICDFGHSIFTNYVKKINPLTKKQLIDKPFGTVGYKAPETSTSDKLDMYSFGKIVELLIPDSKNAIVQHLISLFSTQQWFVENKIPIIAENIANALTNAKTKCCVSDPKVRPSALDLLNEFVEYKKNQVDVSQLSKIDIRDYSLDTIYSGTNSIISRININGTIFAVKQFCKIDDTVYSRMLFEINTLHQLDMKTVSNPEHYSVVKIPFIAKTNRIVGYLMPLAEETLEDYCRQLIEPKFTECYKIASKIIDTIRYIHQMGVIHRNIHPKHILLYNKIPILTDFYYCISETSSEYTQQSDWENLDKDFRNPKLNFNRYKMYTYAYDVYSVGVLFEKYVFKSVLGIQAENIQRKEMEAIKKIKQFIYICKNEFETMLQQKKAMDQRLTSEALLGQLWSEYCELDETTMRSVADVTRSISIRY